MKWEECTVASFEEFIVEIDNLMPVTSTLEKRWWFRGQSSAEWNLVTSYMRFSRGQDLSESNLIDFETAARMEFRSKAHLFVSPPLLEKVKTIPCWWAIMQHHGAPTRLIDWTLSPYVAAYFAVQNDTPGESGAVWGFCSRDLEEAFQPNLHGTPVPDFDSEGATKWYEDKIRDLKGQKIVIPLTFHLASSERMIAQQGRFTMCFDVQEPHNCIISRIGQSSHRRILIPHDKKPEFLLRLRNMNITGASLFPGVDGLGRSVRELMSLLAHYPEALTCPLLAATKASP
jgi:FRG domain